MGGSEPGFNVAWTGLKKGLVQAKGNKHGTNKTFDLIYDFTMYDQMVYAFLTSTAEPAVGARGIFILGPYEKVPMNDTNKPCFFVHRVGERGTHRFEKFVEIYLNGGIKVLWPIAYTIRLFRLEKGLI